jgi:hypothetical protein
MTKKWLGLLLIMVLLISFCGIISAEILPAPPTLKITVEKSPLTIYPPLIIYTAQLSYMPTGTATIPVCDFHNIDFNSPSQIAPIIGSVPFDVTGKAVLRIQIKPGSYIAFAQTKINGKDIYSNRVQYKVP